MGGAASQLIRTYLVNVSNHFGPGEIFELSFIDIQDLVGHLQIILFGRGAILKQNKSLNIIAMRFATNTAAYQFDFSISSLDQDNHITI